MFISFSKTVSKFCGFRLGFGLRITKNNFIWMAFILMFVYLLQFMWYMLVFTFWLIYAISYGVYWCVKKIINGIKKKSTSPTYTQATNPNKKSVSSKRLKTWQIVLIIVGGLTIVSSIVNSCSSDNSTESTTPTYVATELTTEATTETVQETTTPILPSINIEKESIYVGDIIDLNVLDATENIVWCSDNEKIANIVLLKDKNNCTARIEGFKEGTAIITAKIGSQELTCELQVIKNPEEITQPTTVVPTTTTSNEVTVYITNTGSKYHRAGCRHLSDSKIEIELSKAQSQGYEPCGTCY